ncbi:hypothetical protein PIB30_062705 [Stylosanthes scabra]|uniref:Uncharacterized protein n=1 Tax=Stylosanthes scabra TaxID=79078 RepID=A0ABU6RLL1_9FABA|nr:hypothetical protein [Stylosanthes scabra]
MKTVFFPTSFSTSFFNRNKASRNYLPSKLQTAEMDGRQRTKRDNRTQVRQPWRRTCKGTDTGDVDSNGNRNVLRRLQLTRTVETNRGQLHEGATTTVCRENEK